MGGFAALRGRGQPRHVALPAVGEKLIKRLAGAVHRIGGGETDGIEAERLGLLSDTLFQRLCHAHSCRGGWLKNRGRHRSLTG